MKRNNVICRKALPTDDVGRIAECLHLTDPYIYPTICSDPLDKDWKNLIAACMQKRDNVFFIEHLSVVTVDGEIKGVACVLPPNKELSFLDGIEYPARLQDGLQTANAGYFVPLAEETKALDGGNVANICIHPSARRQGLGEKLLQYCIQEQEKNTLYLDVIADNIGAIALYEKQGFEKKKAYYGFSGQAQPLPCWQMVRKQS